MRTVTHRDLSGRIGRDQRPDRCPTIEHQRSRTEPALDAGGGGTEPGAGATDLEVFGGGGESLLSEGAVGVHVPDLIAAIDQIEQDRRRHDRHMHRPDLEAPALFRQGIGNTRSGIEPEGRSTRKAPARRPAAPCGLVISRSVSRVPGAPPITSTAHVNGQSETRTVVPDLIFSS